MHFVYVAHGPKRENKQCAGILLTFIYLFMKRDKPNTNVEINLKTKVCTVKI